MEKKEDWKLLKKKMDGYHIRRLYVDLFIRMYNRGVIDPILKEANKDYFLCVFTRFNYKGKTLLGTLENVKYLEPVLSEAQRKGILNEFIKAKILSSENGNGRTLVEFITDSNCKSLSEILGAIRTSCGLEAFWKVMSEFDRCNIKNAIESKLDNKHGGSFQNQIKLIEKKIEAESKLVEVSTQTDKEAESKTISPTSKAVVAGAICGVIAGLAVGGGLFAAGVALPILAIIGIAVAAALVTGLVAGGITYTVLKPSEGPSKSLDNVDAEQKVSSGLVQQFS